jgi:predicted molibdopterin-dependent oxidoreductase YjgC
MAVITLTINGQLISARDDQTILQAARETGIPIPTLATSKSSRPTAAVASAW